MTVQQAIYDLREQGQTLREEVASLRTQLDGAQNVDSVPADVANAGKE